MPIEVRDTDWPLLEEVDFWLIKNAKASTNRQLMHHVIEFAKLRPHLTRVSIVPKKKWEEDPRDVLSAIIDAYNELEQQNNQHPNLRSLLVNLELALSGMNFSGSLIWSPLEAAVCRLTSKGEDGTSMDFIAWFLARPEIDRRRMLVANVSTAIGKALLYNHVDLALEMLDMALSLPALSQWDTFNKPWHPVLNWVPMTSDVFRLCADTEEAAAQVAAKLQHLKWPTCDGVWSVWHTLRYKKRIPNDN
jgi:hypothetical protein